MQGFYRERCASGRSRTYSAKQHQGYAETDKIAKLVEKPWLMSGLSQKMQQYRSRLSQEKYSRNFKSIMENSRGTNANSAYFPLVLIRMHMPKLIPARTVLLSQDQPLAVEWPFHQLFRLCESDHELSVVHSSQTEIGLPSSYWHISTFQLQHLRFADATQMLQLFTGYLLMNKRNCSKKIM